MTKKIFILLIGLIVTPFLIGSVHAETDVVTKSRTFCGPSDADVDTQIANSGFENGCIALGGTPVTQIGGFDETIPWYCKMVTCVFHDETATPIPTVFTPTR